MLAGTCIFALGLLALTALPGPAAAEAFGTDYGATIRGFGVGSAKLRATIEDDRYTIQFSAKVGGLARLVSDMETAATVTGAVEEGALRPAAYEHTWREDDDAEVATIRFDGRGVSEAVVDPPPRRPERRVPIGPDDLENAIDLATAFVWPAPDGVGPEICNRTLPLFDGTQRYDLAFSFTRSASFQARDGSYSGPAMVCAVRFRPISGHRRDRDTVEFMAANEEIEVWIAPAGDDFAIPVRIRVPHRAWHVRNGGARVRRRLASVVYVPDRDRRVKPRKLRGRAVLHQPPKSVSRPGWHTRCCGEQTGTAAPKPIRR